MVGISNTRDLIQETVYKMLDGLKEQKERGMINRDPKLLMFLRWYP